MRKHLLKYILVFGLGTLFFIFWPRSIQNTSSLFKSGEVAISSNAPLFDNNTQGNIPRPSNEVTTSLTDRPFENTISSDPTQKLAHAIEEQNAPVSFYGKVVDQDGNSLAGVRIILSVRQWHSDPAGTTYPKRKCVTDSDGRFEWTGENGDALTVEIMTKEGYRLSPKTYFGYSPSSGNLENPIVFKMWKEGAKEPLISGSHVFGIDSGKIYTLNLLTGKKIEGEAEGDLQILITRPNEVGPRDKFPWSFSLEAIQGGFAEPDTNDEFMYIAPESGYQPKIEMQFDPKDPAWVGIVNKQFFVTSRNGQIYGCVKIEIDSIYNVHSAIQINYAVNPNGSRNLQP